MLWGLLLNIIAATVILLFGDIEFISKCNILTIEIVVVVLILKSSV